MFDINPPNWTIPSFMQRADLGMIRNNKKEIIKLLRDFRDIMSEDREGKNEIMRRGIERG